MEQQQGTGEGAGGAGVGRVDLLCVCVRGGVQGLSLTGCGPSAFTGHSRCKCSGCFQGLVTV